MTFVTTPRAEITARGDHGHGGHQHQGLRRHDLRGGHADDHHRQPGQRRHAGVYRELRYHERGYGQDAHGGRLGQRRQRRQQLHGDLRHEHDGRRSRRRRSPSRRPPAPRVYDGTTSATATPTITSGSLVSGDTAAFTESYDTSNAGTGKTLTPAGSVNDGNGGNNYTVTFVNNTTGLITGGGDHGHGGRPAPRVYDGTTTATATPTITGGSLAAATRPAFTETYDTKNAGTGKTLTPAGSVNDGNSGNNYTVTFVTNTTGRSPRGRSRSRRPPTPRSTTATTTATATPTITPAAWQRRHGGLHRDLRHQERRARGKTLTRGRLGQRRQQRQQLHGDLRHQHDGRDHGARRSRSRRPPTPRATTARRPRRPRRRSPRQPGQRRHGRPSPRPTTPRTWARARRSPQPARSTTATAATTTR